MSTWCDPSSEYGADIPKDCVMEFVATQQPAQPTDATSVFDNIFNPPRGLKDIFLDFVIVTT
ncbi:MAG TPA: hypothetical protein VKM55_01100 [Candidatus Lokiarchaeia archaeon]|nr:hypothetical protein [Candidatus Lokiarchaeia archaeon]